MTAHFDPHQTDSGVRKRRFCEFGAIYAPLPRRRRPFPWQDALYIASWTIGGAVLFWLLLVAGGMR